MPVRAGFATWYPRRRSARRTAVLVAVVALVAAACSTPPAPSTATTTTDLPPAVASSADISGSTRSSAVPGPVEATSVGVGTTEPAADSSAVLEMPMSSAVSTAGSPGAGAESSGCPGVRCLSIVVTGDVLLHPPLVDQARADSPDGQHLNFGPMLAAEQTYVRAADLGICHLETPLAPPDGPFAGYPEFSVPPQVLPALVATGYDACSTASNHTLDQGTNGVNRTLDDLDAAGLAHDGSYRTAQDAATPTSITTPHGRVGFISATYGFND